MLGIFERRLEICDQYCFKMQLPKWDFLQAKKMNNPCSAEPKTLKHDLKEWIWHVCVCELTNATLMRARTRTHSEMTRDTFPRRIRRQREIEREKERENRRRDEKEFVVFQLISMAFTILYDYVVLRMVSLSVGIMAWRTRLYLTI